MLDAKLYYDCPLDEDCQPSPYSCTPHFARSASEASKVLTAAAPAAHEQRGKHQAAPLTTFQQSPTQIFKGHGSSGESSTESEWTEIDGLQCGPVRTTVSLNASGAVHWPDRQQQDGPSCQPGNCSSCKAAPGQLAATHGNGGSVATASSPVNEGLGPSPGGSVPIARSTSAIAGSSPFEQATAGTTGPKELDRAWQGV